MEDELSRKKTELALGEKRIRMLQESLENDGLNSSDDEALFDEDSDAESITSTASLRHRTSFRRHSKRLSKRGSDLSGGFDSFSMMSSNNTSQRRRRIPNDDYINGGISGSRDTNGATHGGNDTMTPSRYTSRTASRGLSKFATRQNSFE